MARIRDLEEGKSLTMKQPLRQRLLGAAMALALAVSTGQSYAGGIPVFDGAAVAQAIQNVVHQVSQINNQVQMIQNQINALKGSPFTLAPQVVQSLMQMKNTLDQATALTHNPATISSEFQSTFPQSFAAVANMAQIAANLNNQVDMILNSTEDAALLQARVASSMPQIASNVQQALALSNAAVGQTQAIQAGNQLNAVLSTQLNQLNSLMIAEQRTAALERAAEQSRAKAALEIKQRARANLGKIKGTGYTPDGW